MSKQFGERLTQIRQARHMTVREVARRTGIHKDTIANYENNRREPTLSFAVAVARVLEVSLDYLAMGEVK